MKNELLAVAKFLAKTILGLVVAWAVLKMGTDVNVLLEK